MTKFLADPSKISESIGNYITWISFADSAQI